MRPTPGPSGRRETNSEMKPQVLQLNPILIPAINDKLASLYAVHKLFELPNEVGLTSMILAQEDAPPLQPTGVPGLTLLASGPLPPRPAWP